jgi:hypothetical protein
MVVLDTRADWRFAKNVREIQFPFNILHLSFYPISDFSRWLSGRHMFGSMRAPRCAHRMDTTLAPWPSWTMSRELSLTPGSVTHLRSLL